MVITFNRERINRVRLPILICILQTLAEFGAYQRDSSRFPPRRPYIPPTAIGTVTSLSGPAIAYRRRSLPRVSRHRTSSSQGTSGNVCCLFRSMNHFFIRLSFSTLTHYCYWHISYVMLWSFFSFFNLTYSRWTSSLPSCLWPLRIFPSLPTWVWINHIKLAANPAWNRTNVFFPVHSACVCVVIPFILDVRLVDAPVGVTQEEGHTGFPHLPSAVLASIFLARRIQPSLSLVDRASRIFVYPRNNRSPVSSCWA